MLSHSQIPDCYCSEANEDLTGTSMFSRKLQHSGGMDNLFAAVHILHTSSSIVQLCAEQPIQPACYTLAGFDMLWY